MIGEPWNTILFVALLPLLQQLFKFLADKYGFTLNKLANQGLALVISGFFVYFSGGFAGINLPVWNNDIVQFIGDLLLVFGTGWAALMALYDLVWDKLYVKAKIATTDKY